ICVTLTSPLHIRMSSPATWAKNCPCDLLNTKSPDSSSACSGGNNYVLSFISARPEENFGKRGEGPPATDSDQRAPHRCDTGLSAPFAEGTGRSDLPLREDQPG